MIVDWTSYRNIVVLTGAGISVASGLRPYRGPGGIWEEQDVGQVADVKALQEDPARVWSFFEEARDSIAKARPNPAHLALAQVEAALSAETQFLILTQNIDGLHQAAGSRNVVEIHGSLNRSRCTQDGCDFVRPEPPTEASPDRECPTCPKCGHLLRPDVVLFGEPLSVSAERAAKTALRECDLFVAIGTSGLVSPAANYVRSAEYAGARTLLVNLEPMQPPNPAFQEEHLGPAEELVPRLCGISTA